MKRKAIIKSKQVGWTNWIKEQREAYLKMTPMEAFRHSMMGEWPNCECCTKKEQD